MTRFINFIQKIKSNSIAMYIIETAFFLTLMLLLFYFLALTDNKSAPEFIYNQF